MATGVARRSKSAGLRSDDPGVYLNDRDWTESKYKQWNDAFSKAMRLCAGHFSLRRETAAEPVHVAVPPPAAEPKPESEAIELPAIPLRPQGARLWIFDIIRAVADFYRLSATDIVGPSRVVKLIRPRHVAMYLCRECTSASLNQIGRVMNKRDHSSIWHGVDKITRELETDADLRAEIALLKSQIEGTS